MFSLNELSGARLELGGRHNTSSYIKTFLVSSCVLFLLASCGPREEKEQEPPAPPTPRQTMSPETLPVATVDGKGISLDLFNMLYKARTAHLVSSERLTPGVALRFKKAIANELINEHLIRSEAQKREITVTQKEVASAMAKLAATFPSEGHYQKYLSAFPGGKERLVEIIKTQLLAERLSSTETSVTERDVRAYFEKNRSHYEIPRHLIIQDIFFSITHKKGQPVPAPQQKLHIKSQQELAESVLVKATKKDASFDVLARQYSEGPTAKRGGISGRVTESNIDAKLWTVLAGMRPGQVSGVVRTADGYHILKLLERRPAEKKTLVEVQDEIKRNLVLQRRSSSMGRLVHSLRDQAEITNHLAERYRISYQLEDLAEKKIPPRLKGRLSNEKN